MGKNVKFVAYSHTMQHLIKTAVIVPVQKDAEYLWMRCQHLYGKFRVTTGGETFHFKFIEGNRDYVKVQRKYAQKLQRLLRQTAKDIYVPPTPREIVKPILPQSIFDTIESIVIDFFEAIDGLGTTRGFGNTGMLFTGPPGVGKSETMRWLKEVAYTKYRRGTHTLSYRQLHDMLTNSVGLDTSDSLIFIDDIEASLLRDRSKPNSNPLTSQFLTCLDGVDKREGRVIIVSTNEPVNDIDPALTRPGRFDTIVNFDYPTLELTRQFCESHEIDLDPTLFEDWSFARIDLFSARYRVANYRHGTTMAAFYEKFIAEMGEADRTVEAYINTMET